VTQHYVHLKQSTGECQRVIPGASRRGTASSDGVCRRRVLLQAADCSLSDRQLPPPAPLLATRAEFSRRLQVPSKSWHGLVSLVAVHGIACSGLEAFLFNSIGLALDLNPRLTCVASGCRPLTQVGARLQYICVYMYIYIYIYLFILKDAKPLN
jgi:hypothetical protein